MIIIITLTGILNLFYNTDGTPLVHFWIVQHLHRAVFSMRRYDGAADPDADLRHLPAHLYHIAHRS